MSNYWKYLQCLIPDRTVGYLFPHSLAMSAFGVPNEYQINKHRPQLVEGQDWFRLKGEDHIIRVYYSLAGLLKLADLINSPQAQAFKQSLIHHCQGGAIVKSQPAPLSLVPTAPTALYAEPCIPKGAAPNGTAFQPPPTADPAYRLAQYLQPDLTQAVEQAMSSHSPASSDVDSPSFLTAKTTAALIFEAQQVCSQQILTAQQLMAKNQPPEIHVTVHFWERWNTWLDQQDPFAFALVAAGMLALAGVGGWLLVTSAVHAPPPAPSPITPHAPPFPPLQP